MELRNVKDLASIYDLQIVRKIFISFTKNHSIEQKYFTKNKNIIDLIVNEKIPTKQTENIFLLYKENKKFIKDLEKEICRIINLIDKNMLQKYFRKVEILFSDFFALLKQCFAFLTHQVFANFSTKVFMNLRQISSLAFVFFYIWCANAGF